MAMFRDSRRMPFPVGRDLRSLPREKRLIRKSYMYSRELSDAASSIWDVRMHQSDLQSIFLSFGRGFTPTRPWLSFFFLSNPSVKAGPLPAPHFAHVLSASPYLGIYMPTTSMPEQIAVVVRKCNYALTCVLDNTGTLRIIIRLP